MHTYSHPPILHYARLEGNDAKGGPNFGKIASFPLKVFPEAFLQAFRVYLSATSTNPASFVIHKRWNAINDVYIWYLLSVPREIQTNQAHYKITVRAEQVILFDAVARDSGYVHCGNTIVLVKQ